MFKRENRTIVEAEAVKEVIKEEAAKKAVSKIKDEPLDLKNHTIFVSTDKENVSYSIRAGGHEIRGSRDKSGQHLIFRVPNDLVESFKKHEFVTRGRLVVAHIDR
jgi:hypothetical protein